MGGSWASSPETHSSRPSEGPRDHLFCTINNISASRHRIFACHRIFEDLGALSMKQSIPASHMPTSPTPPPSLRFPYVDLPHPARPLASSPAPGGGGGSRGDTRGKPHPGRIIRHWTVGGIATGGGGSRGDTRGKPHPGERTPARPFLQVLPIRWTVGDISTGVGQTGRGQKAPSPVSGCNMQASA